MAATAAQWAGERVWECAGQRPACSGCATGRWRRSAPTTAMAPKLAVVRGAAVALPVRSGLPTDWDRSAAGSPPPSCGPLLHLLTPVARRRRDGVNRMMPAPLQRWPGDDRRWSECQITRCDRAKRRRGSRDDRTRPRDSDLMHSWPMVSTGGSSDGDSGRNSRGGAHPVTSHGPDDRPPCRRSRWFCLVRAPLSLAVRGAGTHGGDGSLSWQPDSS